MSRIVKLFICIGIVTAFGIVIELATFESFTSVVWCLLCALVYLIIIHICEKARDRDIIRKAQKETIKAIGAVCVAHREDCSKCPIRLTSCPKCEEAMYKYPSFVAEEVNNWIRSNRQEWFLSKFPKAALNSDGILSLCPRAVFGDSIDLVEKCCFTDCDVCRKEFWTETLKEEKL